MARGFALRIAATLLAAASMAMPAVETDGIGLLADAVMATAAVDDLPIIMSCPPTLDVLPDLYTEAADAWSSAAIEEIRAKTSLAVWKSTSAPRAPDNSYNSFTRPPEPTRHVAVVVLLAQTALGPPSPLRVEGFVAQIVLLGLRDQNLRLSHQTRQVRETRGTAARAHAHEAFLRAVLQTDVARLAFRVLRTLFDGLRRGLLVFLVGVVLFGAAAACYFITIFVCGRRGASGSGGIDRRSILFDNSHSARGRPARGALRRRQEHHDLLQSALQ